MGGALTKSPDRQRAVFGVVDIGARVGIDEAVVEDAIDEDGELAGRGRDGLGFAGTDGETPTEGAERGLGAADIGGGEAQDGGRAIGGGLGPAAQQAPAGDLVAGGERQPGREVLLGRPAGHVGADFGEQPQGVIGADPVQLGQVHARELVQRSADLEAGLVSVGLVAGLGRREGRGGRRDLGCQVFELRLNRGIARGELLLQVVEELQILTEDKDVFGAIGAGQRRDDLGFGRVTPAIPMLGELHGIGLASDDVAENAESGQARDVGDDERELDVHLDQGLLHAVDVRAGTLDQRLVRGDN